MQQPDQWLLALLRHIMPHFNLQVKIDPSESTLNLITNSAPQDILLGGNIQDYAPTPEIMQQSNFGSMFSEMEQEMGETQSTINIAQIKRQNLHTNIGDSPGNKEQSNPFLELVNRSKMKNT